MFDNAFEYGSWQYAASGIESAYFRNKPKENDFAIAQFSADTRCYLQGLPHRTIFSCFLGVCGLHEVGIKK